MSAIDLRGLTVKGLRDLAQQTWGKGQVTNLLSREQLVRVIEADFLPDIPKSVRDMAADVRGVEIDRIINTALQGRKPAEDSTESTLEAEDEIPDATPDITVATLDSTESLTETVAAESSDSTESLTGLDEAADRLATLVRAKIAVEREAAEMRRKRNALTAEIEALQAKEPDVKERLKKAHHDYLSAKMRLVKLVKQGKEATA